MLSIKRALGGILLSCSTLFVCGSSFAADKLAPLIAHPDPVVLPGIGRVLLGFVITVAVGVAVVYALRRWLPRLAIKGAAQNQIGLTTQCTVRNGMRFHVVTVADQTILVVEGKTGVAMTIVPITEKNMNSPAS